jgi:hypothetical protein
LIEVNLINLFSNSSCTAFDLVIHYLQGQAILQAYQERKMSTINISYAMNHATNLDAVVDMVNAGTFEGMEGMEFSSEQLAGQYAFNAASTGDYPVDADAIAGQLEFLSDAGAVFNPSAALAHGLAIAAAE